MLLNYFEKKIRDNSIAYILLNILPIQRSFYVIYMKVVYPKLYINLFTLQFRSTLKILIDFLTNLKKKQNTGFS